MFFAENSLHSAILVLISDYLSPWSQCLRASVVRILVAALSLCVLCVPCGGVALVVARLVCKILIWQTSIPIESWVCYPGIDA